MADDEPEGYLMSIRRWIISWIWPRMPVEEISLYPEDCEESAESLHFSDTSDPEELSCK